MAGRWEKGELTPEERAEAEARIEARLLARPAQIAEFLLANPGILAGHEIRGRPSSLGLQQWIPGEECWNCRGERRHGPCPAVPACHFRYKAGFFTRQGGICPWCGNALPADLAKTAVDHVVPVSRGGPWVEQNLQLLHLGCNTSKGNRVTAGALELAAAHEWLVADFLPVQVLPGAGKPALVHLLASYRKRIPIRAICGFSFGFPLAKTGAPATGDAAMPQNATCRKCRATRQRLGPGNSPAPPYF
jgi:HNH endonuclease